MPCVLCQVGEQDFEVAAELPQDLAAGAARRRRRLGVGDDREAREGAVPFGERLEHRDPLGADGQAVGGVLDVAAGDDRAVGGFERGADLEVRERRIGVLAGAPGGGDQIDVAAAVAQAARAEPPVVLGAAVAFGAADIARPGGRSPVRRSASTRARRSSSSRRTVSWRRTPLTTCVTRAI